MNSQVKTVKMGSIIEWLEMNHAVPHHDVAFSEFVRPIADVEQWLNQFREEFRNNSVDGNNLTQLFTQFVEEYRQREERRASLEQRVEHFRSEFMEAMTETAMSFINICQDLQGQGDMFEQLRGCKHPYHAQCGQSAD